MSLVYSAIRGDQRSAGSPEIVGRQRWRPRYSVIEYLEAVRATTKRFDIRSRVRLSQAMACAAPTESARKWL